jgi:succinate dehydrogenase / fumarate reductase cytochrome b subunit
VLYYQLPLPGIVSILHRISGILLFLAIPILLWILDKSLASEVSFIQTKELLDGFFMFLVMWAILGAITYHLVAGIKHLIMDMGFGETTEGAELGSKIALGVSAALILLLGIWLW